MEKDPNHFTLDYKDGKLSVRKHSLDGQVIYRIQFSDKRPPLIITRALHANANKFWTSVPEGRQREAEEVGPLISAYYKSVE